MMEIRKKGRNPNPPSLVSQVSGTPTPPLRAPIPKAPLPPPVPPTPIPGMANLHAIFSAMPQQDSFLLQLMKMLGIGTGPGPMQGSATRDKKMHDPMY